MHQSAAVCRICLAVDALVSNIDGTALQLVYERLTGALLVSGDRPVAACYICRAQLNKSHKLMVTATRADSVLTAMLEKGVEITEKSIALIDRKAIGLGASLSFSVAESCNSMLPARVTVKTEPESVNDDDAVETAMPLHEVRTEPESVDDDDAVETTMPLHEVKTEPESVDDDDVVETAMPLHEVKTEPESVDDDDAVETAMPLHEVKTEPDLEDAVDTAMNDEDPGGM